MVALGTNQFGRNGGTSFEVFGHGTIALRGTVNRQMSGVVPQADRGSRKAVFVRQRAQARRVQEKVPRKSRIDAKPAGGQHSQEMSTGEYEYVIVDRS